MTQVVLIAGSGETSRANVEALIDDYIYSTTDEIEFIIAFERTPSQGQVFANQLAKHRDKKVTIYSSPITDMNSVGGHGKITQVENPYGEAFKDATVAFLLWNDDDALSSVLMQACKTAKIKAFDLTDGLVEIQPSKSIKEEVVPDMPEEEKTAKVESPITLKKPEPEEEPEEDEEELEDEEEEEEEYLVSDILVEAIEEIARIFAVALADEFEKRSKK